MILFGDRIFVDIIRVRIDMGTKSKVSTQNREKRTQRHREENYKDKAEIRVMQLETKVHWGLLGTTRSSLLGKAFPPETSQVA